MRTKKPMDELRELTGLSHWPLTAEEEKQQFGEREAALATAQNDPKVRALVQDIEHRYEVARMLRGVRTRAHLTQAAVAAKLGTRQAQVTRIESG